MSITVNGQSVVPPGFRFHPTEEELLSYYLRKKVACEKIDLDVIRDVDLNKLEPWDIQEKCRIGSTPQNDWYFFSHKDKKYPTGTRTNRATAAGFWKATGRDKIIHTSCKRIGMRKTLVFYKGRAPRGQKSDWIMHEYRLDEHFDSNSLAIVSNSILTEEAFNQEDGWVICRVFKKKNLHKAVDNPNSSSSVTTDAKNTHLLLHSSGDGALDQILQYMGRSCKLETEFSSNSMNINKLLLINERFMKLPALQSPTIPSVRSTDEFSYGSDGIHAEVNINQTCNADTGISDWAALDKLIASQLNGQFDDSTFLLCQSNRLAYNSQDDVVGNNGGSSSGDGDLWSLASSGSEHITRASHPSM